jgi:hypothetical protein
MHGKDHNVLFYFGTWGFRPEGNGLSPPRVRSVAENNPEPANEAWTDASTHASRVPRAIAAAYTERCWLAPESLVCLADQVTALPAST